MPTDKIPASLKPIMLRDILPGAAIYYTDPSALLCDEQGDCWLTPYHNAYPANAIGLFTMRISNLAGVFQVLQSSAGIPRIVTKAEVFIQAPDVLLPVHFVLV